LVLVALTASFIQDKQKSRRLKKRKRRIVVFFLLLPFTLLLYGAQYLEEGVLQMRKSLRPSFIPLFPFLFNLFVIINYSRPHRRELYISGAALLQLPQTWARIISMHRTAQLCSQTMLFVRWRRAHPS
jgi:hypothetical protein